MVYWESGAVADQLTGRALPLVFRVGANGADLGGNSARFVATQIAPRLHTPPAVLRAFLRWFNLLVTPEALMEDPEVVGDVLAAYQDRDNRPAPVPLGPDRAALLERISQ